MTDPHEEYKAMHTKTAGDSASDCGRLVQPTAERHMIMARVRDALHLAYQFGEATNADGLADLDGRVHRLLLEMLGSPAPSGPWRIKDYEGSGPVHLAVQRGTYVAFWGSEDECEAVRDALNAVAEWQRGETPPTR